MPKINLTNPPYTEADISAAYAASGCAGVGNHFATFPIHVGDCVRIGGAPYRITAVKVFCQDAEVYGEGNPPPETPPDHLHTYQATEVEIRFWLEEISEEEYCGC